MAPTPTPIDVKESHPNGDNQELPNVQNGEVPIIQAGTSSESEAEEHQPPPASGYQLLPSDPNSVIHNNQNETDEQTEGPDTTQQYQAPLPQSVRQAFEQALEESESVHLKEADFRIEHKPRKDEMQMNEDKVATIKSCMSGFNLPTANHPKWASAIREDDWKNHLLNSIKTNSDNFNVLKE